MRKTAWIVLPLHDLFFSPEVVGGFLEYFLKEIKYNIIIMGPCTHGRNDLIDQARQTSVVTGNIYVVGCLKNRGLIQGMA